MVQPPGPYQNQGYGGQAPWGQPGRPPQAPPPQDPWGQPAPGGGWSDPGQGGGWSPTAHQPPVSPPPVNQPPVSPPPVWAPQPDPGYGAPPDPWSAPVSAPTSGWPGQPGYPPPQKSNTGLVVAVIGAVVVLVLVIGVGLVYLLSGDDGGTPSAGRSAEASPTPSDTPTTSPTPETKDPESLDSKETDETRLSTTAIFPDATFTGDNGETYTLAGTLETSACDGVGSGKAKELLNEHDCGRMVVGVWLDSDERLFSALLVIPFNTKSDAEALYSDIASNKQAVIDSLTYYCPSNGKPGADLCKRSSDNLPTWYASFTTFHRYLFIAVSLYTDGHRTSDVSEVDDFTSETVGYVTEVMLGND